MQLNLKLPDVYEGEGLETVVEFGDKSNCLMIGFKGYGDACTEPPHGRPIIIEIRNGTPFLIVLGDVNQEDPTHIIDLGAAAESKRKEDDDATLELPRVPAVGRDCHA